MLIERQCSHEQVDRWYRAADLCLVTSLHDGMNLVAKEYLAARDDEDGVLVLSKFTGAATELRDALLVNPYDIEGVAEAIHQGLEMSRGERRMRMQRMRRHVMDHNVYRWAASILGDLRELRMENSEPRGLARWVRNQFRPTADCIVNWPRERGRVDAGSTSKAGCRFFETLAETERNPLLLLGLRRDARAVPVNRFEARPWAGVRELLTRIQRQGRTRMAVVTGRPAIEIAPLLGLEPPLEVWGLHGAERLYPDGRRELEEAAPEAQRKAG
jgi:phosphoglycolate phosphatase-like HAD superfamily hydrolase